MRYLFILVCVAVLAFVLAGQFVAGIVVVSVGGLMLLLIAMDRMSDWMDRKSDQLENRPPRRLR